MGLQTLSRHHLSKLLADAIVLALAYLCSEGTSRLYETCPCGFVQRGQVLLRDALTDEGVDEACIEVVASADGADGWYRRYVELEGVVGRTDSDATGSAGADEEGTVVGDVLGVDGAGIAKAVHDIEIVGRSAHYVAMTEILDQCGTEVLQLVLVRLAEVKVVIYDGMGVFCLLQHTAYVLAGAVARGIEGTEEEDVAGSEGGHGGIAIHAGCHLVEHIIGIAVLVEIGQRDGTLLALAHDEIVGGNAVVVQEIDGLAAYMVAACIAEKQGRGMCPSQRDDAIETAASGHGSDGLVVLEENVHNGLSHCNYSTHFDVFCCKTTTNILYKRYIPSFFRTFAANKL